MITNSPLRPRELPVRTNTRCWWRNRSNERCVSSRKNGKKDVVILERSTVLRHHLAWELTVWRATYIGRGDIFRKYVARQHKKREMR